MNTIEDLPKSASACNVFKRIVKFFLCACVGGGLIGGLAGVAFVVLGTMIDPQGFRMGGGKDTAGVAALFFLPWGLGGLLLGFAVGVLGALVMALRR